MRIVRLCLLLAALAAATATTTPARAEAPADEPGFQTIFNGKDLEGWDGDPRLWSVKEGVIRGETTAENPAKGNTFLVWKGGTIKDFILKVRFRIQNGNSGIQYRSKVFGEWRVGGYQAEVAGAPGKVGFLYHEAGRASLAGVGDFVVVDEKGEKKVVGKVADVADLKAKGYYRDKDWNEYVIIARGNFIQHFLNGYPTIALIDEDRLADPADPADRKGAAREGILALQIHAGPPMVVEFTDIRIKTLTEAYGNAVRLFNGEDLAGWTPSSDALKDTFGVSGGVITDTGKPAGYLRTEADHTSYALSLQLKHVSGGNSGVLVRAQLPDKVWPKSIECQGQTGSMGDIWNIDKFPMTVDPARTEGRRTKKLHDSNERPLGEWNDYDITMSGGDLAIRVNNLLQNTAADCDVVPGKICLQAEGSAKEFRNIVLVPIGGEAAK
jgi:hypothetical protein